MKREAANKKKGLNTVLESGNYKQMDHEQASKIFDLEESDDLLDGGAFRVGTNQNKSSSKATEIDLSKIVDLDA